MNKTAIKNFAIWARNKLIADIEYRAGLMGITENGIAAALPQSTGEVQFFDIGTKEYTTVRGNEIRQRESLISAIRTKEKDVGCAAAFHFIVERAAYTWFNRLIAIRFMEVNDYLPSRVRVLSSENKNKAEPDMVTRPFDTDLKFSDAERAYVTQLKDENKSDELFRRLFIRQCYKLHEVLPLLFDAEHSDDRRNEYLELLLTLSFTDKDGVLWHLVHDIPERDFRIRTPEDDERQRIENIPDEEMPAGQVEIIGWMYQYYNTEPKNQVFADLKKNIKISKDKIPAATQLFTPDWIVRYMVENSLGRLWVEGHPNEELKKNWKYYLEEAEQEPAVQAQLTEIRKGYAALRPEDIRVIDPCMGSGHILVYLFEVLMQIYESQGWTRRDAAQSIVQNNLYGLDIDERAAQLAYFAVMMKARQYDRRFLDRSIRPKVYAIQESNGVNRDYLRLFGEHQKLAQRLMDNLTDAKEYGSILKIDLRMEELHTLREAFTGIEAAVYDNIFDSARQDGLVNEFGPLLDEAEALARKYDVVVTNPPYMGNKSMSKVLQDYIEVNYQKSEGDLSTVFMERCLLFCREYRYSSMINIPVWMFSSSYKNLRKELIKNDTVSSLLHCGRGIFGADFGTVSFVFKAGKITNYRGAYKRLYEKQSYVDSVEEKERMFFDDTNNTFSTSDSEFSVMPNYTFAYWTSKEFREAFKKNTPLSLVADVKKGTTTGDDSRFLRYWNEVDVTKISLLNGDNRSLKWHPFNKGGDFRRWYGNNFFVVNWEKDGYLIRNNRNEKGKLASRPQNIAYFYRAGITWTYISISTISFRYYPEGFAFAAVGPAVFPHDGDELLFLTGFLNSKVAQELVNCIGGTGVTYETGEVSNIPTYVCEDRDEKNKISKLVEINISVSKQDWDSTETSWDFRHHPLINESHRISDAFQQWEAECNKRFQHLKSNEEELNRIFIDIYGLQDELTPEVEEKDVTVRRAELGRDIRSLVSYAVGCMFGRYSLDVDGLAYAGGAWDAGKYNTFLPDEDNCIPITDEAYFEDDIVGRFVEFIRVVYGADTLEENLAFIARALGNRGSSSREVIRNYFLNDFFKDHVKIYQKRPIYWLFDAGRQNGFKALVYMHRWNADTVGSLRVEYLHKMQRIYEKEIERMQDTIDNGKTSREINQATKRREKLIKQLKETRDYDAKIAHAALSRVDIDLDDGVKVNYEKVQKGPDGKTLGILAKI